MCTQPREPSPEDAVDAHDRALSGVVRQVIADYPWAAPEYVDKILRANFDGTREAKVHTYRLLLAERDTRARLRRESPTKHLRPSNMEDT